MSAFSSSMNYGALKRKVMGSKVSKMNIAPSNGSVFNSNGVMEITLPQAAATYAALSTAYLKFDIQTTGAAGQLDKTAFSLLNRIDTTTGAAVIDSLTSANVYYAYMLDAAMDSNVLKSYGKLCLGSGGDPEQSAIGADISHTAATQVALPLFHGLFGGTDKLIPLDSAGSGITFKFYLEDFKNAFINVASTAAVTGYTLKNVELCLYATTLSPEAQAHLDDNLSGIGYNVLFDSVSHTSDSKVAATTAVVSNLGFRYSAVSRVDIIHRAQDNLSSLSQHSISNRSHANMMEINLTSAGQSIPERPIRMGTNVGGFAEVYSEGQIAWGNLGDQTFGAGFNGVNRAADGTSTLDNRFAVENGTLAAGSDGDDAKKQVSVMGTYGVSIDTDVVKQPSTDGGVYSGISTLGGQVGARIQYSAASTKDQIIDYFCAYTAILSLDPISRSWMVSV